MCERALMAGENTMRVTVLIDGHSVILIGEPEYIALVLGASAENYPWPSVDTVDPPGLQPFLQNV